MSKHFDNSHFIIQSYRNQSQGWFLPIDAKLSILQMTENDYSSALVDNWDGQGAKRIELAVLSLADQVLSEYATPSFLAEVCPGRAGSLSFVWDDGGRNYVYLDVGPQDTLHLYYNIEREVKWEGVSLANDALMHAKLFKALSFTRQHKTLASQRLDQSNSIYITSLSQGA